MSNLSHMFLCRRVRVLQIVSFVTALGLGLGLAQFGSASLPASVEDRASHLEVSRGIPAFKEPSLNPHEAVLRAFANINSSSSTAVRAPRGVRNGHLLAPVGDLDGDGKADVVAVDSIPDGDETPDVQLTARRGFDGEFLWQDSFPADLGYPFPTRVGPDGKQGIIFVAYVEPRNHIVIAPEPTSLIVTALSSSGTRMWERKFDGLYDPNPVAIDYVVPKVLGFMQAGDGNATDLLVSRAVGAWPGGTSEFQILSGRDGATLLSRPVGASNTFPFIGVLDDLDADARDEVMVGNYQGDSGLGALKVVTPSNQELWSKPIATGGFSSYGRAGDVDGDGQQDLFLLTPNFYCNDCPVWWLLDGKNGDVLQSRSYDTDAGFTVALGDIDADGRDEVGIQRFDANFRADPPFIYYSYRAVDGVGQENYFKKYSLADPSGSGWIDNWWNYGDVNGDNIPDQAHVIEYRDDSWRPDPSQFEWGVISGATGEKLWTGEPRQPLGCNIDGDNHDLVRLTVTPGIVKMTAADGLDGSSLWSTDLGYQAHEPFALGSEVTGDSRCDVIVNDDQYYEGGIDQVAVLDGTDGSVLWLP